MPNEFDRFFMRALDPFRMIEESEKQMREFLGENTNAQFGKGGD